MYYFPPDPTRRWISPPALGGRRRSDVKAFVRPAVAGSGPDLPTQLEDIFNSVWAAEANWRLDDRIDLALKQRRDRAA